MSRIIPKDIFVREGTSIRARGGRAMLKHGGSWRKLASEVGVARTGAEGDKAFQSCVRVGGSTKGGTAKRASGFTTACAHGRNPREAIRKALSTASRKMAKRSGAFAGTK